MFTHTVEYGESHNSEGESEHDIMRAVRSVEQIPRQFTDCTCKQQHQKISHAVAAMSEPLGDKESEHRERYPAEASQQVIHGRVRLHKEVGAMVGHHREDGDNLQRTSG